MATQEQVLANISTRVSPPGGRFGKWEVGGYLFDTQEEAERKMRMIFNETAISMGGLDQGQQPIYPALGSADDARPEHLRQQSAPAVAPEPAYNPLSPPVPAALIEPTEQNPALPESLTVVNPFQEQIQRQLDELEKFATSEEDSIWLQKQKENIQLRADESRDLMRGNIARQVSTAREALAARGGLRSGAAERLEERGIEAAQMAEQGIGRDVAGLNLQAELAEAGNKLSTLQGLPSLTSSVAGQELGRQQTNVSNVLTQRQQDIQNRLKDFEIRAGIEAARRQAEAQRDIAQNTGGLFGGGGVLGLGIGNRSGGSGGILSTVTNPIGSVFSSIF